MSRTAGLQIPFELAIHHEVLFAVELLDAVSLERVYRGIDVIAEGLKNRPIVNVSGLFVWRKKDASNLQRITIDPGLRPFEPVVIPASEMQTLPPERPLKTVELSPTINYPFPLGITGLVGKLVQDDLDPTPIADAAVRLQWQDENDGSDVWRDAPTVTHTNSNGHFAALLRLTRSAVPKPVSNGSKVNVRLQLRRGTEQKHSDPQDIFFGQMTRPTSTEPLTFAWQDLNQ